MLPSASLNVPAEHGAHIEDPTPSCFGASAKVPGAHKTHAALAGSSYGAHTLGEAYFKGKHGLPKDDALAKRWLGKVAAGSVHDLGQTYVAEAAEWLAGLQ